MARIDEKYTEALGNFNKSLGLVVELLEQQVKNKDTDILESMLKNMGDNLGKIVEDLKEVKNTNKKILSQNDKILQEIKSFKSKNESGMFGQISDPKNKNKIIDGIKIITLISVGVLAIGMAFKIIGHVDFLSVIGLGISISIVVATFAYISEKMKNVSIGRTLVLSGLLVVISLALTMSSRILMFTAPLTLKTMLSISFTALAIGGALFLLSKSIEKIHFNLRTIVGFLLLPFLAPIVSTAIVLSSHILKNAATIDFKTILSVTFTSIALGIALYAITTAVSKMNMKSSVIQMLTKGAVFGALIGAVAGGIVLASWILSKVSPISLMQGLTAIFVAITLGIVLFAVSKVIEFTEGISILKAVAIGALMVVAAWAIKKSSEILSGVIPFSFTFAIGLVLTSIAIGVSLLAFVPAWKLFSRGLFSKATAFDTAKNVIIVAATIALSSWIISMGNYTGNVPGYKWSFEVGTSLVVFGGFMMALAILQKKAGFTPKFDGRDIQNIALTAGAIVLTSLILQFGIYTKYPSTEWVTNVGISLVLFGGTMFSLGKFDPSGEMILRGVISTLLISGTIWLVSKILGSGSYDKYPPTEWVTGVGISMVVFGAAMYLLGSFSNPLIMASGALSVLIVAGTIWLASKILNKGSYDKYPSLEWSAGVGLSLFTFGTGMILLGLATIVTAGLALLAGAGAMVIISKTIVDVSKILAGGNFTGGPSLEWAMGTGLLLGAVTTSILAMAIIPNKWISDGIKSMKYITQSIVDVSKILAGGTYTGGPTFEWAEGVGTAIMAFASAISSMGMATGGIMTLFTGIDVNKMKQSISAVVDGMVEANRKLSDPTLNWTKNFPSEEWALGVGTAVTKFAEASRSLTGGWFSRDITSEFSGMVDILMGGIISAARQIQDSKINWNSLPYPSTEWITNIGSAIQSFIDLSRSIRGGWFSKNISDEFNENINVLLTGLISVGTRFSTSPANLIKWNSLPYPKQEWIKNISDSVYAFINLSKKDFDTDNIKNLDNMIDSIISIIEKFSKSTIKWESLPYPKQEWIKNIGSSIESFLFLSKLTLDNNLNKTIDSLILNINKFTGNMKWESLPYPKQEWIKNISSSIESFISLSNKNINVDNLNKTIDSLILNINKFTSMKWETLSSPKQEWVQNIRTSLLSFIVLSKLTLDNNLNKTIDSLILNINKFTSMKWESLSSPKPEWIQNIGTLIKSFIVLSKLTLDNINLNKTIDSIILNINKFTSMKWESLSSPKQEWIQNINSSILSFIILSKLTLDNNLNKTIDSLILNINKFTGNMKWESLSSPKLEWVQNIRSSILSFIVLSKLTLDNINLNKTIDSIILNINKFTSMKWESLSSPKQEWIQNINSSIESFIVLSKLTLDNINLNKTIDSLILNINKFTGNMKWETLSSPKPEWIQNIGTLIKSFIVLSKLTLDNNLNKTIDSLILNINKFTGNMKWELLSSPKPEWIQNIGSLIKSFIVLSKLTLDNINLNKTIDSIILNINKFTSMKWESLSSPKQEWIQNINSSIESFTSLSNKNMNIDNLDNMVNIMISVAKKFNGKDIFNADASKVVNQFSMSLKELSENIPSKELTNRLNSLSESISKISGIGLSTSTSIWLLSKSLKSLGETIQEIDITVFDKLTKFSSSFVAISLIDNMKLQQTIDIIKNKKLDIKAVMDDNSSRFTSVIPPYLQGNTTTVNSPFMNTEALSNPLQELVNYNKNIDKNIQELVKFKKAETEATDNYTTSAPQSIK